MVTLEWILVLLLGAVLLAALARRIGAPSPALLALGGVAVAFLKGGPRLSLNPDLALALFVAPVLLDAAFDSSLRDLKETWFPVTCLVVLAVAVTTAAVAIVARWLVPAMSWPVAIALGAIVAPPDAAAATAVLKEIKLPHRLLAVLEGESLLNDASALLIYRLAVGAALAHAGATSDVFLTLTSVLIGSILLGAFFAFAFHNFVARFSDAPSSIVVQFVGTFGAWIIADHLHLSGVLTIVTFAIILSRRSPMRMPAAIRVPSYAVWETAVFLLNALAFILIGLQIGPILSRFDPAQREEAIAFAAAVLITTIAARIAWVMTYNRSLWLTNLVLGESTPRIIGTPQVRRGVVVAWCGMRGIVTLAAALALPDGSGGAAAFPYRDLIVLSAFTVVLGTLVIQGLTLRPLVLALGLEEDDHALEDETRLGREEMLRAALGSLGVPDAQVTESLHREFSELLGRLDGSSGISPETLQAEASLRARAYAASRERLAQLRLTGAIGDSAFQQLEAELDMVELEHEFRTRW
ncbi:MAG TPA: cation:proton antiporter [Candidatus Binataceae bacterium]|nr:cation:proton antiporter [Candidatus Binataceae bacterium]